MCGPILWRKLEPQARLDGLRPTHAILSLTYGLLGEKEKTSAKPLDDLPLSTPDEVQQFWKTLRETFKLDMPPLIRRAEETEASAYPYQDQIEFDDFPSPDLSSLALIFIVEANKSKFMILVKSEPAADMKHFGPEISWVEFMQSTAKQE
jgi:hypothetical protein